MKTILLRDQWGTRLNLETISEFYKERNEGTGKYTIVFKSTNGKRNESSFLSKADRDFEYDQINTLFNHNKKEKFMDKIKKYFEQHNDTYITLGIIILIDHFVFEGKFREKIKEIIDNLLAKTEKQLLTNGEE